MFGEVCVETNGTKLTKGGEQRDTPDVGFDEVAALKDKLWGDVFVLWVRIALDVLALTCEQLS